MRTRCLGFLCILTILFTGFAPRPAWADVLSNGSFENPSAPGSYEYVPGGLRKDVQGITVIDPAAFVREMNL